jgi:phage/plasmid primase-like uncharacterized protein
MSVTTGANPAAREVAARLGLHRVGREWRGACPACGYAEAFALTDGKHGPIWWCASCGDRNAIARAVGGPRNGIAVQPSRKDTSDIARRQERAERILRGAEPVAQSPAAIAYLGGRGLSHLGSCPELFFRADCPHPSSTFDRPVRLPAIIAVVRDVEGKFIAIHRTFLKHDGSGKTQIEPPRASLGPIMGGAVRLASLEQVRAAGELVVGEGIETSASAGLLLGLPAWAAVSAGNLAKGVLLPPEIPRVVIAADRDTPDAQGKYPGQDAARAAWFRLRREGRTVRVALPDEGRGDFNDILKASEVRQ